MLPEKKTSDSTSSGLKKSRCGDNSHFVFVSDESGIIPVFELIKSKLRSELNGCLTLIYSTPVYLSRPLFRAELDNLEKRFPSKLITHYVFNRNPHPSDNTEAHQQIFEIVINSNTCGMMQFLIVGQEEFADMATGRLQFLGVRTYQISLQII
jgi:hypothetical protein